VRTGAEWATAIPDLAYTPVNRAGVDTGRPCCDRTLPRNPRLSDGLNAVDPFCAVWYALGIGDFLLRATDQANSQQTAQPSGPPWRLLFCAVRFLF